MIDQLEAKMKEAAKLDFEDAANLRDGSKSCVRDTVDLNPVVLMPSIGSQGLRAGVIVVSFTLDDD